jgi:hypothetical protein
MLYQQGDLLIKSINNIPNNAIEKEGTEKGFVLAEGEHTGHMHRILTGIILYTIGTKLYFENLKEVKILHEEHNEVILPPGTWEVDRVREYDHFREETRVVLD